MPFVLPNAALRIRDAQVDFSKKLRRAAHDIHKAAAGKTCSTCRHYRGTICEDQTNIDGGPLLVMYPGAPACSAHKKRT